MVKDAIREAMNAVNCCMLAKLLSSKLPPSLFRAVVSYGIVATAKNSKDISHVIFYETPYTSKVK